MTWNPDQYLKFAAPRLRPALDLLARVTLDAPAHVADLGCGTGSLTRLLAQRWPSARVIGIDASETMLAQARTEAGAVEWVPADLTTWQPEQPLDLLYSNAALHWLPDHRALFARLAGMLAPGGVLAVQMPANFDAPSHTEIEATVREGPWRELLEPLLQPPPVASAEVYYDLLAPHLAELDLWHTSYLQVLQGPDPVKEWTKGTWLAPLLAVLSDAQRPAFEERYAERLRPHYPMRPDGRTLFPFRRLFIVGRKGVVRGQRPGVFP